MKIIYNEFKNAVTQKVVVENFLPLDPRMSQHAGKGREKRVKISFSWSSRRPRRCSISLMEKNFRHSGFPNFARISGVRTWSADVGDGKRHEECGRDDSQAVACSTTSSARRTSRKNFWKLSAAASRRSLQLKGIKEKNYVSISRPKSRTNQASHRSDRRRGV